MIDYVYLYLLTTLFIITLVYITVFSIWINIHRNFGIICTQFYTLIIFKFKLQHSLDLKNEFYLEQSFIDHASYIKVTAENLHYIYQCYEFIFAI